MTTPVDVRLLAIYLNDHVAGATVGVQRVRRMAKVYDGTVVGTAVAPLVPQLEQEREWLLGCLRHLDIAVRRYKVVGASLAERVGRLKLNGHVRTTSPLSALLEVELLRGAVTGKASGWQTLLAQGRDLGLTPEQVADLDGLVAQADGQVRTLSDLLEVLHARVFRHRAPDGGR
ncbi:hypothetical protein [Oerskovia paurometabola]|uniref:hypothetical protein n=1 Tax=Oerskovia paurometabola TaxID=162170 RepID=UPI0034333E2A